MRGCRPACAHAEANGRRGSAHLLRGALQPRELLQVGARRLELAIDGLLRRHDAVLVQGVHRDLHGLAEQIGGVADAKRLADAVRRGVRGRVGAAGEAVVRVAGVRVVGRENRQFASRVSDSMAFRPPVLVRTLLLLSSSMLGRAGLKRGSS